MLFRCQYLMLLPCCAVLSLSFLFYFPDCTQTFLSMGCSKAQWPHSSKMTILSLFRHPDDICEAFFLQWSKKETLRRVGSGPAPKWQKALRSDIWSQGTSTYKSLSRTCHMNEFQTALIPVHFYFIEMIGVDVLPSILCFTKERKHADYSFERCHKHVCLFGDTSIKNYFLNLTVLAHLFLLSQTYCMTFGMLDQLSYKHILYKQKNLKPERQI